MEGLSTEEQRFIRDRYPSPAGFVSSKSRSKPELTISAGGAAGSQRCSSGVEAMMQTKPRSETVLHCTDADTNRFYNEIIL